MITVGVRRMKATRARVHGSRPMSEPTAATSEPPKPAATDHAEGFGLNDEVAKMNVLLGLPLGRVERVNPLSIFYLMHLLVALLGAASAGFAFGMVRWRASPPGSSGPILGGVIVGVVFLGVFQALYY